MFVLKAKRMSDLMEDDAQSRVEIQQSGVGALLKTKDHPLCRTSASERIVDAARRPILTVASDDS